MTGPETFKIIAQAFADRKVRWLVVGGYAVVAHGHIRFTHDLDVVIDLEPQNCRTALTILTELGFRPRIPVTMDSFADPEIRRIWHDEREMIVFTVWRQSEEHFEQIDIFLREPFDFERAWQDRYLPDVPGGLVIPCIDLERLIVMKQEAGRPKDLEDIACLRRVARS